MTVQEHFIVANELRHHVLEWPSEAPDAETIFLAHGFLDIAWSWKGVAEHLQAEGFRCIAWDWRGHGESEHIGKGGYYHFPDYVLDLDELVSAIGGDSPIHLVGHSMGGTVCTLFSGVRSAKLKTLALVEGLGPPAWDFERTPSKFEAWLATVAKHRNRTPRALSLEECVKRMRIQNPDLPEELGRFLAEKSTLEVEGGRAWRFDALHRTTSPMPFRVEVFTAFLKRIEVPTLVVAGERGFRLPDEADRYGHIRDHRFVELPEVGHMIHWLQPTALAGEIARFIRSAGR